MPAGTIPTIGLTALQLFQKSGAPWTSNPSVVVTSGQGGTGYMAIQLAKTLGAANVTTAATGPGIEMVTALGADNVVDYEEEDIFDALANDSVDIVCDNFGFPGTADKALRVLRSGGTYILLPGGHGGSLSCLQGLRWSAEPQSREREDCEGFPHRGAEDRHEGAQGPGEELICRTRCDSSQ